MRKTQAGELAQAADMEREVLRISTAIYGDIHPSTLTAMNNLALTLADLGQHVIHLAYRSNCLL
jgi:hypothetical protein